MKNMLKTIIGISVLTCLCIFTASASSFSDVDDNAWYAEGIEHIADVGIMNGYEDGTFRPNANVTRAEVCAILDRINTDSTVGATEEPYVDVSGSKWYYDYVLSYVKYIGGVYKDSSAMTAMGPATYAYPTKAATREQVAAGIYYVMDLGSSYHEKYADISALNDASSISATDTTVGEGVDYRKAIGTVVSAGYMIGDENNNFNPQKNITRAELAQVLARIYYVKSAGVTYSS